MKKLLLTMVVVLAPFHAFAWTTDDDHNCVQMPYTELGGFYTVETPYDVLVFLSQAKLGPAASMVAPDTIQVLEFQGQGTAPVGAVYMYRTYAECQAALAKN